MLILVLACASKLCLIIMYILIIYQINSINQSEVGLKEHSMKKLVRTTWAGQVEKWQTKTGKESSGPQSRGELEVKKTEIYNGGWH